MSLDKVFAKLNETEHKQYQVITRLNDDEYRKLYHTCHVPSIRYSIDDLFHRVMNDPEMEFMTDIREAFKIDKYLNLFKNDYTLYLVSIILLEMKKGNLDKASTFSFTLTLKFYASLFYKFIRYCNPSKFEMALNQISHSHIYKQKNGIAPAIKYISDAVFERHKNSLDPNNSKTVIKYVYELRQRLNQSIRSFARVYYIVNDTDVKTVGDEEVIDNKSLVITKLINDFLNKFQVLKILDEQLIEDINMSYHLHIKRLMSIFKELQSVEYHEELTHILSILINPKNIDKLKNGSEWVQEIGKILLQKSRSNLNPRIIIAKLILNFESYKEYFVDKNMVTKRRLINIIITYFMLSIRKLIYKD